MTVRSNWVLYAEEFLLALETLGQDGCVRQLEVHEPMTAFEAKYHERGHALFQVQADLTTIPPELQGCRRLRGESCNMTTKVPQ